MGHSISAIILKNDYNKTRAKEFDLIGIDLKFDLTMFFIDLFYSACWQEKLKTTGYLETNCPNVTVYPREYALYQIMKTISIENPVQFIIIQTDYHGGVGNQFSNLYTNEKNSDLNIKTINEGLRQLGVIKGNYDDEFEAVGLGNYRTNPEYLDKYRDLADKLGV